MVRTTYTQWKKVIHAEIRTVLPFRHMSRAKPVCEKKTWFNMLCHYVSKRIYTIKYNCLKFLYEFIFETVKRTGN